jgi:hypothetical protein
VPVTGGAFRFTLPPGRYRLRAFLDGDQNGVFDAKREAAGDPRDVVAEPAALITDVRLNAPPGVQR